MRTVSSMSGSLAYSSNASFNQFGAPQFGVGRSGFTPICSDFPVFFLFVPICAPQLFSGIPRFVPICSDSSNSLTLQSLLFSISLLFSFSDFPCFFLCVFPLFSKDFRGSAKRKTLAFLGENPCFFFPKKQGLEGQGLYKSGKLLSADPFCKSRAWYNRQGGVLWSSGPGIFSKVLNLVWTLRSLAAQCEIPPHIAQYPFEIVSQRGVSHPFALFSWGIAQVSLRYPFLEGGYRTSTSHAPQGGNAPKRGRGYRTRLAMLRHPKPHSAQARGVSLR